MRKEGGEVKKLRGRENEREEREKKEEEKREMRERISLSLCSIVLQFNVRKRSLC